MPHCRLEYSRDALDDSALPSLLLRLHEAVVATDLYPPENVKVRAFPAEHALVAGRRSPCIHVTMRILSGKTADQRRLISNTVFEELVKAVPDVDAVTVEVVEMERESYSKKALT